MSPNIGAPGTDLSRRDFAKASGTVGIASLAGCAAGYQGTTRRQQVRQDGPTNALPPAGSPDVVDVTEQDDQVTLRSVTSRLGVHPGEQMGGPVELPAVWAFQDDDSTPSVPGPIIRTEEGADIEVTLDNTDAVMPHTLHFHGVRKTWENDGVSTATGITVMPGEEHTYEIPANVPGTHLYHCHYQTHRHVDMGMYGVFRVDPEGYEPADTEVFTALKDWDSRLNRQIAGEDVPTGRDSAAPTYSPSTGGRRRGRSTPRTARRSSSRRVTQCGSTSVTTAA